MNKRKNSTLYISLDLFGLINYFTRVLCNLVSNISDNNSSITCGCRSSQMCINSMSKDTIFVRICILLINSVKLTISSLFRLYVCEKRVYRRQDNFAAKMRLQNESSPLGPQGRQWLRNLCKQGREPTSPLLCQLTTLLLVSNSSWLSFYFFRLKLPKGNAIENSEVRFLSNIYINLNNVFTFSITNEYW